MANLLLILSGATSFAALVLAVYFLLSHTVDVVPKLLACLLLIDQGVVTILFLRLPLAVPPLRLAVRIGSIGISFAGVLLFVWNAIPREGLVDPIVPALGLAMLAQGVLTWRYLTMKSSAPPGAPGGSR